MAESDPTAEGRSSRSIGLPRLQFSLAWLMIAVTVVAVVLALGGPLLHIGWLIVRCVVPTPLVICAIFGRGYLRAFAIGALMPWVLIVPWNAEQGSFVNLFTTLICSAACGFLAAATWRWVRKMAEP
jgi:hypothetical protein